MSCFYCKEIGEIQPIVESLVAALIKDSGIVGLREHIHLMKRIQIVCCVFKDDGQNKCMSSKPHVLKGQQFHQVGHLRCG